MRDPCLFSVGVTYLKIWKNGGNIHGGKYKEHWEKEKELKGKF